MSNKLALNFICKNESHVILKMLNSVKDITDLIVFNDTGSTDNTIEIVENFGKENNIPVYSFKREFDNFSNSRNYALDKLIETVDILGWDKNKVYHYWIDCDEVMFIDNRFNKNALNLDFYMIDVKIDNSNYTRNTLFRLSKDIKWIGPIHEYLKSNDNNITTGKLDTLKTIVSMTGNSWNGDISKKYKKYSLMLEDYINNEDRSTRWVFYTAQSYYDCAITNNTNKLERNEMLRRSLTYYNERLTMNGGIEEEKYWSQYRIACIYDELEMPINEVSTQYLKAYEMDTFRCESLIRLSELYLKFNMYELAYIYTSLMVKKHHNKFPYPKRMLFIQEDLYKWKILDIHCGICYYTNNKEEGSIYYKELINIMNNNKHLFTEYDINKINNNSKHYL